MQTENAYIETDLGNIALNPRGEYSDETSYEYLDTVSYMGGSYMCLAELTKNISGIAPESGENTQYWQMLTLPGQLTPGAIAMHDDIVNKSKQVETSRAAVELSQQAVEDAQVDVRQMRQDTQEASESAIASRDAAAGYAQAAEASRTAAAESEQNINAQVNNFNTHVSEKTSVAEASIEEARKKAIDAVTTQQDLSIKAVTDEETRQTNAAIKAVTTQQNNSVQAIADEASEQIKKIKDSLDKGLSEEGKAADAKATGDAISVLKEDLSNLSSSKISKFYATNNGENHLADSDDGKIADMMVYGKSEQKSTMGKNLLKLSEANAQGNANGLSATMNADGSISVTGASTSTWSNIIKINNECHTDNATYTFSVDKNSGIIIGLKLGRTKLDDANYQTHRIMQNQLSCTFETGASNEYCSLFLEGLTVGKSYNFTIYPMLELGTEATAYEPYTGGQPSPSPDYPQEIKSVVNPIVKVCGKNLLPFPYSNTSKTQNGVTFDVQNDGTIHIYGTASAVTYFNFSTNIEWGSEDFSNTNEKYKLVGNLLYNANNKILSYAIHEGVTCDFILKPMVVLNTETDLTYEPYHEQTVTLPYTLNAIPVASNGNVTIDGQQYVSDYIDVERGKVVRCVKREPLSKNGRLSSSSSSSPFYTYNLPSAKPKTITEVFVLCNLAQFNSITTSNSRIGISSDGSNSLRMRLDGYATLEQYTRLSAEIIYELVTPQEIDLTPDQIQAFKSLATNYPVTNIEVSSDQLDGLTVFNYPISMANGWNYVKQQIGDTREYIYDIDTRTQDIDTQSAEAYVNSEYAVALTELEV